MRWLFSPHGTLPPKPFWIALPVLVALIPGLVFLGDDMADLWPGQDRISAMLGWGTFFLFCALSLLCALSVIALIARRLRDAGWPALWALLLLLCAAVPPVMILIAEAQANFDTGLVFAYFAIFFATVALPILFVLICLLCLWPSVEPRL